MFSAVRLRELDKFRHLANRQASGLNAKVHYAFAIQARDDLALASVGRPGPAIDKEAFPSLCIDVLAGPGTLLRKLAADGME
jgi:hypothetical protein